MRIEQEVIHEQVGSQDQVWAAYGGVNLIAFQPDGTFHVSPIVMSHDRRAELESHLLLFFTGFSRIAGEIAAQEIPNLRHHAAQLETMTQMVHEAACILQSPGRSIREIGPMLHESWLIKKELADCVSSSAIDQIYDAAVRAGALGGKLLGAGGGGFMLLLAEPSSHDAIRRALKGLIEVSFSIGSPGSTIVIYEPDGLEERRIASPAGNRRHSISAATAND